MCERYLTMADLRCALKEGRVKEMFGSGTACVVSPVGRILYQGEVHNHNSLPLQHMDEGMDG